MHPKVASAIEEIDAAVFSGDTFEDPAARTKLLERMAAWMRELAPVEGADEVWSYSSEYMLEFSSVRFLAVDSMGVTHSLRSWRTTHRNQPGTGDFFDCNDELVPNELTRVPASQCVTCMTCIVHGARADR